MCYLTSNSKYLSVPEGEFGQSDERSNPSGIKGRYIDMISQLKLQVILKNDLVQMLPIILYLLGSYRISPAGKNCPIIQIVAIEQSCRDAANLLGLKYRGTISRTEVPAGCYWNIGGGDGSYAHFNEIIDPSKTNPNLFWARGGICMNPGDICILDYLERFSYNIT